MALDTYKINGILNSRIERALAEQEIERASKGIEELIN